MAGRAVRCPTYLVAVIGYGKDDLTRTVGRRRGYQVPSKNTYNFDSLSDVWDCQRWLCKGLVHGTSSNVCDGRLDRARVGPPIAGRACAQRTAPRATADVSVRFARTAAVDRCGHSPTSRCCCPSCASRTFAHHGTFYFVSRFFLMRPCDVGRLSSGDDATAWQLGDCGALARLIDLLAMAISSTGGMCGRCPAAVPGRGAGLHAGVHTDQAVSHRLCASPR